MSPRLFWRLYWPVALIACAMIGAPLVGPRIEHAMAPVRIDQHMENIRRSADRICWEWVSVKARPLVSDNMDAFLETRLDRFVVAIFERDTGMPWARSRAVGLGPHRQPYCILLPPSVAPGEPLRVRQTIYYPGWLGLWHVAVVLPDVEDPPGAAVP